jgi:hypothetical protein
MFFYIKGHFPANDKMNPTVRITLSALFSMFLISHCYAIPYDTAAVTESSTTPTPVEQVVDNMDFKPPPGQDSSLSPQKNFVEFMKRLYTEIAYWDLQSLAKTIKHEYDTYNKDGNLADTLETIYDIRQEDLRSSVEHISKMKTLIDIIRANEAENSDID